MSDFVSEFWNIYVAGISLAGILGCAVLLWLQSLHKPKLNAAGEVGTSGHVWDEDLEEFNHPLPKWWMWLFVITIVFSLVYLVLYPGLGRFQGILGWTQVNQYAGEVKKIEAQIKPIFDKYSGMDLKAVAADPGAQEIGKRLYLTYCSQCHGSDAKGSKGFPNLTDSDWLYGGDPAQIKETILNGRNGMMPAYGGNPDAVGGEAGAREIANYVRSLSGLSHDAALAGKGKEKFATVCVVCHGADGKGMQAMGAPNLTDKVWLYGSSEATIVETITKGRQNKMPAWKDFLGEAKVHMLAAYVISLSAGATK